MNLRYLKKLLRLHWMKMLVGAFALTCLIILGYLLVVGMQNFLTLESFYKKMTLASIPLQFFLSIVTAFVFAAIYMGFNAWFMFGGGMAKMGQKRVKPQDVDVKWNEVIGMDAAKKEAEEVIGLIKDRTHLKRVGGKIIKGILMVGPPGCGKTYLAKAIATETGVPFLSAVGSEFMGIFVGVGSSKIRSLFKEARILADLHGGCLVFIDEIDTIARPRVSVNGMGAGMDYNATVNQLLTEMDGMRNSTLNVVIIAATNVNENELDPALMRAGRFDRKVYVGKPNLNDREKLFQFYMSKTTYDPTIDMNVLAKRTVGFSPADVSNMVREASLIAVRNKRDAITYKDFSEAYDRVVFGLKSQITLSEKEKNWTAYHETGHAIIAYLTHPTDDVIKASIVPRKGALGYVGHRPKEELHAPTRSWYIANIKICLAGYAAEQLKFGSTSSGVSADFRYALDLASDMVHRLGMGQTKFIGDFYMMGSENFSEDTKKRLDEDVQKILHDCLKEVNEILGREQELIEYFAQELLKKGELEYDEIVEIFKKHGKERPQDNTY